MSSSQQSAESQDDSAHGQATIALAITVVGSTVPIWGGYLLYQAFSKWNGEWAVFYRNGEFYLYTTSFLSSAAYIFYRHKRKDYDLHSWMFWFMLFVIGVATILFAALRVVSEITQVTDARMSPGFLQWTSSVMIAFSIAMLYWALVLQHKREPDLKKAEKKNVEKLGAAFDRLS